MWIGDFAVPLNEDEIILGRMRQFHRERSKFIQQGSSVIANIKDGLLVVHLFAKSCVDSPIRFEIGELAKASVGMAALSQRTAHQKPNIDGLLKFSGIDGSRAYAQIFRNGVIETVASRLLYSQNSVNCLRHIECEQSIINFVSGCVAYFGLMSLQPPIWMFSSLIGCRGSKFNLGWDFSEPIDRDVLEFPEIQFEVETRSGSLAARIWCDFLWQSIGSERSPDFDESGDWRDPR